MKAYASALGVYLLVRGVALGLVAIKAHDAGLSLTDTLIRRFDGTWYLAIADHGYADTTNMCTVQGDQCRHAFFPLYPALIRAGSLLLHADSAHVAAVITLAAALAAACGIFAVVRRVMDQRTALIAVALWGIAPHAIVQSMAYTEALFTALAAWSLYAVLTERWITAGALCLLAGLARPTAVALIAAILVAAIVRVVRGGLAWRPAVGVALASIGWLGWFALVARRTGRWDGYFAIQKGWGSQLDGGTYTMTKIAELFQKKVTTLDEVVVTGTIMTAVILLLLTTRQPLALVVFVAVLVLITVGGAGYYHAKARFLLPAFPLLIPAAKALASTRPRTASAILAVATPISAVYGTYLLFISGHSP